MGFITDNLSMKKNQDDERTIPENISDFTLIGNDVALVHLWHNLKDNNRTFNILAEKPCLPLDINNPYGVNLWRGEANKQMFSQVFSHLSCPEFSSPSLFYRDQKFRNFGGRSRSMPFLYQEELLTKSFGNVDLSHLEDLLPAFNEAMKISYIDCIEKLDDSSWLVRTADGLSLRSRELVFADAPYKFLQKYLGKALLSEKVVEAIQDTNSGHIMFVEWQLDSEATDREETLFIPQSLTHEHGHFVGQFMKSNKSTQKAVFMTFLDENEHSEAEIVKKIRLLKRQLIKIFPSFDKKIKDENYIHLAFNPFVHIDDKCFSSLKKELPKLSFLSPGACLEHFEKTALEEKDFVFGPARSFYSCFEFLQKTNHLQEQDHLSH